MFGKPNQTLTTLCASDRAQSEAPVDGVAQLVRAAEPVHPMFSVANNQFLNGLVGQGRAPATNETG